MERQKNTMSAVSISSIKPFKQKKLLFYSVSQNDASPSNNSWRGKALS